MLFRFALDERLRLYQKQYPAVGFLLDMRASIAKCSTLFIQSVLPNDFKLIFFFKCFRLKIGQVCVIRRKFAIRARLLI